MKTNLREVRAVTECDLIPGQQDQQEIEKIFNHRGPHSFARDQRDLRTEPNDPVTLLNRILR